MLPYHRENGIWTPSQSDQAEAHHDEGVQNWTLSNAQDPPDLFSEEKIHFVSNILQSVHLNDQSPDHPGNQDVNKH